MNKQGKTVKYLSTFMILVFLSLSIYIYIPESVKLVVENTNTKFFVWEDDSWTLSATEYVNIFDGTKKMRASSRDVQAETNGDITTITRYANWKDNISTVDTYTFDSSVEDVTLFPIDHTFQCINCEKKIVHFEYRDILYTGETRTAVSPENFGHQMKVEWEEDSRFMWAKVYQQRTTSDKLVIRYRATSNDETFNVRLYDPPGDNYTIIGNKVFYNDSKVYLSSEPATMTRSGYVTEHTISKNFTGNITVAWGFNTSIAKPQKPELYKPHNVSTEFNYTCDYSFNFTTTPEKRAWCFIEYTGNISNGTDPWNQTIFNRTFETGDIPSKTVFWSTSHQEDYIDFPLDLTAVNYSHAGMDTWYVAKNVPVVAGIDYEMRFLLNIKPNLGESSGKYWRCVMPSSYGRDISQAKTDGNLFCLDPWFNTSYEFKKNILCDDISDGMPIVVNGSGGFTIDSDKQHVWTTCQGTGTAVYYNNATSYTIGNDSVQLPHEVEKGNGTSFNPTDVWTDEITRIHFKENDSTILDSTESNNGTVSLVNFTSGGYIGDAYEWFGDTGTITLDNTITLSSTNNRTLQWWLYSDVLGKFFMGQVNSGSEDYLQLTATSFVIRDLGGGGEVSFALGETISVDTWYHVALAKNGTNYTLYLNGVSKDSPKTLTGTYTFNNLGVGWTDPGTYKWDGKMDEFSYSGVLLTADVINQTYQNYLGTSDFGTLGVEELQQVSLNLSDFLNQNIDIELGSLLNITANSIPDTDVVCIDIDHPDYGVNYSCAVGSTSFILNFTDLLRFKFSNTSQSILSNHNGSDYNASTNVSTSVEFNNRDTLISGNISIIGLNVSSVEWTYEHYSFGTLDAGSVLEKEANAYDGSFSTFALIQDGTGSTEVAELYRNYSIPKEVSAGNIRYKYTIYIGLAGSGAYSEHNTTCWNYTDGSWANWINAEKITTAISRTRDHTKVIPTGCFGEEILQTRQVLGINGRSGGNSTTANYEESIQWNGSIYPHDVKLYINESLDRNFIGRLNGTNLELDYFKGDTFRYGNLTYYYPGTKTKYLYVDKNANVESATMDIFGFNTTGVNNTFTNVNNMLGMTINVTQDKYYVFTDTGSVSIVNKTTNAPILTYGDSGQGLGSNDDDFGATLYPQSIITNANKPVMYLSSYESTAKNTNPDCAGSNLLCTTLKTNLWQFSTQTLNPCYDVSDANRQIASTAQGMNNLDVGGDIMIINDTHAYAIGYRGYNRSYQFNPSSCIVNTSDTYTKNIGGGVLKDLYGVACEEDVCASADNRYVITTNDAGDYEIWNSTDAIKVTLASENDYPVALDYDNGVWYVTDGTDNLVYEYTDIEVYPGNVSIDVGQDGNIEWNLTASLTSSYTIDLNTTQIETYLEDTCTESLCEVPVAITTEKVGKISYSSIMVITNTANISMNVTHIQDNLNDSNILVNTTFTTESKTGNIELNDLSIIYLGGNNSYEIKAHTPGYNINTTYNATYYHSDWNLTLPTGIEYIAYFPWAVDAKNVTPFGQTSIVPIINITTHNTGGDMNFSIYLNQSEPTSCVNLTVGTTNNKSAGQLLGNKTWYQLSDGQAYGSEIDLFLWADLNCSYSGWTNWKPVYYFRGCYENSDICSTAVI